MSTTVAADPAGQPVTLSTNDDDEADLPTLRSDSLTQLEWGPIEHLAYYSCDESDRVSFDLSCLHSFSQPSLPANLARGRELFYQRNKHNRSLGHPIPLDNLVRACLALGKETELHSADIITWRGVLVKLMLGIRMDLKFYIEDNALYIMEYDKKPHVTHGNQLKQGYHGYSFEALCTQPPDTLDVAPTLDVWKCIVRRSFGDFNIVFGAEVDCVEGKYEKTSRNLMELKTEILGEDLHSARVDYKKKKKKWYLQSYLIGIPEICIGYRDTNFILRKMERVPLDQLYSPPSGTLQDAYAFANRILESLRNFCSSPGYGSSSGVWKVTVQRGMLLEQPQMV